jgi:serine/threonine-protein phosphatase 2A regulatory subunit B'
MSIRLTVTNFKRTIHGMVYNAMKLFMEVNPQLFDDCSHDYAEQQNHASEKLQSRQARWDKLAELAKARQNGRIQAPLPTTTGSGAKVATPMRPDDSDPLSQESQRRLEGLRLQDDASGSRRPKDYASGNSVS